MNGNSCVCFLITQPMLADRMLSRNVQPLFWADKIHNFIKFISTNPKMLENIYSRIVNISSSILIKSSRLIDGFRREIGISLEISISKASSQLCAPSATVAAVKTEPFLVCSTLPKKPQIISSFSATRIKIEII